MKRSPGYTLPELLIALSLTVILASLAVPSLAGLVRRTQAELYLHDVLATFQHARSSAISRREPVVFCANANNTACGNDWSLGAIAFTDPNNNRALDTGEKLLLHVNPPPEGTRVILRAALNKTYLRVMPNGMLENTAGSLVVCPPAAKPQDARNLIFSRNGRMRFGDDRNRDGIRENADGQPLSCPS